ncbi:MAG: hypothetical protein ACXABY_33250, partial [Candidatus Thorarchaeota archaeon]
MELEPVDPTLTEKITKNHPYAEDKMAEIEAARYVEDIIGTPSEEAYSSLQSIAHLWDEQEKDMSSTKFRDRLRVVWRGGRAMTTIGLLSYKQMEGDDSVDTQWMIDEYAKLMPGEEEIKRALPAKIALAMAEMAPIMLEGMKAGGGGAVAGGIAGLAGAGGMMLAGGPVTWGMLLVSMQAGSSAKSADQMRKIEAGLMYHELKNLTNKYGEPIEIDPAIAKAVSHAVGAINGAIEMVQVGKILKGIPLAKHLFGGMVRKQAKQLAKKGAFNFILNYAKDIGEEVAQEMGQETTNIIFTELAIAL